MELKDKVLLAGGIISGILYIFLASSLQSVEAIWYLTRIFGLLSFFTLFFAVTLGELRLLSKVKGEFTLFRFHTPLAKMSVFLVFLHFVSAVFDKFKWGKYLIFKDFLGFSFGDKWLTLLSLGTIAFYFMLLVALTSIKASQQKIGYKNWKKVHYFSYLAFFIAYIHSANLGTDIRHSEFTWIVSPIFVTCFLFIVSLFLARLLNAFKIFQDQYEMNLAAIFFLLLIFGSVLLWVTNSSLETKLYTLEKSKNLTDESIKGLQYTNSIIKNDTAALIKKVGGYNDTG